MTCNVVNLTESNQCSHLVTGVHWAWELLYKDSNGDPIDLSAFTFTGSIRTSPDAATTVLAFAETLSDADTGIRITDAVNGMANIQIASADSTGLSEGIYSHAFVYTDADGLTQELFRGKIQVVKGGAS